MINGQIAHASGRRVATVGVGVLLGLVSASFLVSCAEKTPPPKTVQATAPLTTPIATGVPAGPPVQFLAAAAARPYLLGTISISSVDRLLGNGTKLVGQAMPLPMDAAGLRDMILSQAGLPPEVSANVDFASPSAAAFVAIEGKVKSGSVIAVPARGPAEAQKIIDALGKKISTRGEATLVEGNTGGRGWLYRSGNVVMLSDEIDALARGAMLTLEARHASAEDVTSVMYPEAVARANGTDVKTAVDKFLTEMQRQARSSEASSIGEAAANERTMQAIGEALRLGGDASSIEAGLVADPARGLIIRARFNVRAGTKLETIAKDVKPFRLDPAVATSGVSGRFVVGASSLGPFTRGILEAYRARLATEKQKGASAALAYYDAVLAAMAGQQSTSFSLNKEAPFLSGAIALPLKDAATAGKVGASLAALDAAAASALLGSQVDRATFDWTVKKETVGKVKTQHFRVKLKKKPAAEAGAVTKRLIGQTLDVYFAVADTRLLMTLGNDARARLTAIASGKAPAEPNKAVTEAQTAAAPRDLFYYVDLAPLVGVIGAMSEEQRVAALARGGSSPIPMVFTAGGDGAGKLWTMDMTVPVAAFTGIGSLLAAGMSGQ